MTPLKNPSIDEVLLALSRWQERLRLLDWFVDVRLCHRSEISEGSLASIDVNHWTRSAVVRLGFPDEWTPEDDDQHRDWETNLVHELLHIQWIEYRKADGEGSREIVEERSCNDLSSALVTLARVGETREGGKDAKG